MKQKDKHKPSDEQNHTADGEQNSTTESATAETVGKQEETTGEVLDRLTALLEEEKEKRIRILADYDNYRRRTAQDISRINRECTERVLSSLLCVLDDFDRFLQQAGSADSTSMLQGIELIHRKLTDQLNSLGLTPITALNQPFDVNLHEAVSQIPTAGVPADTVIAEAERGYMLRDKVLRFAKVVVSSPVDQAVENEAQGG